MFCATEKEKYKHSLTVIKMVSVNSCSHSIVESVLKSIPLESVVCIKGSVSILYSFISRLFVVPRILLICTWKLERLK